MNSNRKGALGQNSKCPHSQNVGKVTKYRCLSGMGSKEKNMPEVRNRFVIVQTAAKKKKVLNLAISHIF